MLIYVIDLVVFFSLSFKTSFKFYLYPLLLIDGCLGMATLFPEVPFFLSHILSFFSPPLVLGKGVPFSLPMPWASWCLIGVPQPQQRCEGYRAGDGWFGPKRTGVIIAVFGLCLELIFRHHYPCSTSGVMRLGMFFDKHVSANHFTRCSQGLEIETELVLKCEFPPFSSEHFPPPLGLEPLTVLGAPATHGY